MNHDASSKHSSAARRILLVLGGLVALAVALVVVVALVVMLTGRSAFDDAVQAWSAEGRDLDAFIAERPRRAEPNASALELERLAAKVAINMVTKRSDRERPPGPQVGEPQWGQPPWEPGQPLNPRIAFDDVSDWVKEVTAQESAAIPEPPPSIAAFLDAHAADWAAVKQHLASAPPPLWERDLERGFDAPIPNLLGQIRLARLLLADALLAARDGRHADAEAALEASWKLTASLDERDSLISHLILVAIGKMQAGVMRHLPELDAEEWSARLLERRFHARYARALTGEAALMRSGEAFGRAGEDWSLTDRAEVGLFGHGALAHALDVHRDAVSAVEDAQDCVALDLQARRDAVERPAWNPFVGDLTPNNLSAAVRSALADFHSELTAKVLRARLADGAVGDAWRASRCEDLSYELTPVASGGFRVSFDSDLPSRVLEAADMPDQAAALALAHVEP